MTLAKPCDPIPSASSWGRVAPCGGVESVPRRFLARGGWLWRSLMEGLHAEISGGEEGGGVAKAAHGRCCASLKFIRGTPLHQQDGYSRACLRKQESWETHWKACLYALQGAATHSTLVQILIAPAVTHAHVSERKKQATRWGKCAFTPCRGRLLTARCCKFGPLRARRVA